MTPWRNASGQRSKATFFPQEPRFGTVIAANVDKSARIMTDESSSYRALKRDGWKHDSVNHGIYEYARGDVHTNTVEGFFGNLRRGLDGIYHSVSKKHLHRYLSEFEFRYNHRELSDGERAEGHQGRRWQAVDLRATD